MTCRRGSCWKERERSKRCRVPVADQGGKMLQIFQARLAPVIEFDYILQVQTCKTYVCILSNMQHLPSHSHLLHFSKHSSSRNNIICQHHVEHLLGILCSHIWCTYQQCYTSKSIRIVTSVHKLLMNTPAFFKHMHLANP
jgi:hypothetical protein